MNNWRGIKHFKIGKYKIASYGWHQIHTGTGYELGSGFDLCFKYLTIGKFRILLDVDFNYNPELCGWYIKTKKEKL